jgi:hypothetical protein
MFLGRTVPHAHVLGPAALLALGVLATLLVFSGCATSTASTGDSVPTTTTAPTAPSAPTATSQPAGQAVVVYFSKHPDSDSNVNAVFSVNRFSPDLGVAKYSLQQLIAGPTTAESATGFYTELSASLSGVSNCGGADFQLYPNHKGTSVAEAGTMTIKFCRTVQLAGDLTGARIAAEINKTMLQFSNIHKVITLTKDGGCFNDFQGANACLN